MSTQQLARLPEPSYAARVAANVRAEMARHEVTQRDIARLLGIPQSSVARRARGYVEWRLSELEAVAPMLRTTASRLCAIRDSNPEPADLESRPAAGVLVDLAAERAARRG